MNGTGNRSPAPIQISRPLFHSLVALGLSPALIECYRRFSNRETNYGPEQNVFMDISLLLRAKGVALRELSRHDRYNCISVERPCAKNHCIIRITQLQPIDDPVVTTFDERTSIQHTILRAGPDSAFKRRSRIKKLFDSLRPTFTD